MSYFDERWADSLRRIATATEAISKNVEHNKSVVQVAAANTPRWISVKDRLPEDFEDVVVIISNGLNGYWYRVAYRERGSWSQGGGRRISDEVTHWMPLPEPPKEE